MSNRFLLSVIALLLLTTSPSSAQRENIWAFGTNAGLDFNTGNPVPITTNINAQEGSASVCDANGQLLFYTNGERVWDQTNGFMQNGFSICSYNVSSTTQGALIVPMPDSGSKYYIFSMTSIENGPGWGRLYYSVVDMTLNNGLGAIVDGRKEILVDTGMQENMTAVSGRNCNIWLLAITQQGKLKAFSIDHNGVHTTAVQSQLIPGSGLLQQPKPGAMSVSPNRAKLAVADIHLTLYDFDASTGMASNPLGLSDNPDPIYYSVCFSPNSSKLYSTQLGNKLLAQHDLSLGTPSAIQSSITYVSQVGLGGTLKRGPDGKIYCVRSSGLFLGVVQQPNVAGVACNYINQAITLSTGTSVYLGLPNVIPVIIPDGDTVFNTHIINVADCFTNTHLLQSDSQGLHLVWENGSTAFQRMVNGPGTYWVTYSKHCVVYSDTFKVRFPNAPPGLFIHPACKGSNNGWAAAYTPNAGYSYTWRNNSGTIISNTDSILQVNGGYYTLRVITPLGCDTTVQLYIPEEEHIAAFERDSIVCQDAIVDFNNTSDNHFTQFDWAFGDGNGSALISPSHVYSLSGSYNIRLIAKGAVCTDTVIHNILVDSQLHTHFKIADKNICIGQDIVFLPVNDSTVAGQYWTFGDGRIVMTPATENQVQHAYDSAAIFAVQLTTQYRACSSDAYTDTVQVYPLPKVYLGQNTGLCLHGNPIVLQNQFAAPSVSCNYLWNTGDTTPTLKVVHPGEYSLTIALGPLGCSSTEKVTITKDCYLDIPNAFTPNGDAENDYFFPRQLLSKNLAQFNMKVFNRWGQLIFETSNIEGRGWDGNFNGKPQPQGVYLYLIEAAIANAQMEKYNGNVTLIR